MSVPCTSCGEILDPGDDRCPYCGTLAPPLPGTSVFAHEVGEPRWADDPAGAPTTVTPVADEPTRAGDPLAIPVREPGDPGRRPVGVDGGIPRPVLVALAAVAVMALVAVLAAQLVGSDGDGDVASGDSATTEPSDDEEVAADDTSSTTAEPSTTTEATTTTTTSVPTTTSTTASTTTTTTTAPVAGPGSVPTLPASFRGGWVAQLTSVPASSGTASIEAAYARIRSDVPGAVAARSDEWPSMAPGYWVFVETGFGSEDAVRSFCSSVGRSGDACLPRELTNRR